MTLTTEQKIERVAHAIGCRFGPLMDEDQFEMAKVAIAEMEKIGADEAADLKSEESLWQAHDRRRAHVSDALKTYLADPVELDSTLVQEHMRVMTEEVIPAIVEDQREAVQMAAELRRTPHNRGLR